MGAVFRCLISYEPLQFKGRIGEFPRLLEYGHKIDALRKRYSDRLWEVEFIPTEKNAPKNAAVLIWKATHSLIFTKVIVLKLARRALPIILSSVPKSVL